MIGTSPRPTHQRGCAGDRWGRGVSFGVVSHVACFRSDGSRNVLGIVSKLIWNPTVLSYNTAVFCEGKIMRNTIDHPIEAGRLPAELLRNMPNVAKKNLLRITYEIVDENGFTEEQQKELDQAIEESHDPANLIGPFSPNDAIAYLRSLDNDQE